MTRAAPPASWLQLPVRVGRVLVSPGAALARIEAEGGGFRDAVALVVIGAIAFRLPDLIQALLALAGPTSGAFLRVVAVFGDEAREAAWILLPAAVVITALAGKRRDPSVDLELGAAAYQVFFVVRGATRAVDAVAGMRVWPPRDTWLIAGAAAAIVLARAVVLARGRSTRPAPPPAADVAAAPAPAAEVSLPTGPSAVRGAERIAALALVGIVTVGLGGNAVWSARHLDALRPMQSGQIAPAFSLPRLDGGGQVELGALAGKVVVLDFWATWCPPCIAMLPTLDRAHRSWNDKGVAFVGVNSDGGGATREELQQFLLEHPIPYPVVVDDARVGRLYKVEALPTLVVIGRDGRVRRSYMGITTESTLDRALREALDAQP
jgi:thiol-disulfide isomerase/thioredoxin